MLPKRLRGYCERNLFLTKAERWSKVIPIIDKKSVDEEEYVRIPERESGPWLKDRCGRKLAEGSFGAGNLNASVGFSGKSRYRRVA